MVKIETHRISQRKLKEINKGQSENVLFILLPALRKLKISNVSDLKFILIRLFVAIPEDLKRTWDVVDRRSHSVS